MSKTRGISCAHVADACVALGLQVRAAPRGIRPVFPSPPVFGQVRPARHRGSVDVFLRAIDISKPGDVLVIDNQGRLDEGCIGDLISLEACLGNMAAIVIWGAHRDTDEIQQIGLPVFSYGSSAVRPARGAGFAESDCDSVQFGEFIVGSETWVFADSDDVLFVPSVQADHVLEVASEIAFKEEEQSNQLRKGFSLRDQYQFGNYLKRRENEVGLNFHEYLEQLRKQMKCSLLRED